MFAKLAAIAEAETERLRRWVYVIHALFERHFSEQLMSSKGLPVVGPNELGALMTEGLSLDEQPQKNYSAPLETELDRFVKFIDKNEDGLIDEQELICFCVQGLRQTPEANLAFAARSPMHSKLIGFLEAINSFSGADAFSSNVPVQSEGAAAAAAAAELDISNYKATEDRAPEETEEVLEVKEPEPTPAPEPVAAVEPVTTVTEEPEPVAAVEPVTDPEPVATVVEPSPAAEPAVTEPAAAEPAAAEPTAAEPTAAEPVAADAAATLTE